MAANTFLFTDIEGSTRLWERDPRAMRAALARHDELFVRVAEAHGGRVFKTIGDAFCMVFDDPEDALRAALDSQRELLGGEPLIRVRMAIHVGEAEERNSDFFGPDLSRVNRILEAGHGGQILLSAAARTSLDGNFTEGVEFRDLGERRLRDLSGSGRIFQISAPGLPDAFPPLRTLAPRAGNLPAQPTAFVGREREVAEVARRVREGVRLLTLTGAGGTGKTRISLRAAESLTDEFEDGVFFVPLAPVGDSGLIASTVARYLGVAESGDVSLAERVKEYLRNKETLFVLDNFEHLLEGAAFVSELLSACPKLRVLATSRSPLNLYGEREHPVFPLALPEPDAATSELSRYESVRLFIERAGAVKHGFSITEQNAVAVAEICRRLDGLPLAIELAAARVRTFSPKAILAQLGSVSNSRARDLPERHRSLRKAIGWSHDLLDDAERKLFRRLAIFAGGFTLDAAGAVCAFDEDIGDVYGVTESLLDKSLIRTLEVPGEDSDLRFSMLRTIRDYALERLDESGESNTAGRRHAEYFLDLAERGEVGLEGSRQTEWLRKLDLEHDNLRAALSWSRSQGESETELRIAGALGWFWAVRGHMTEGHSRLEEALAAGGGSSSARAKALNAAGGLAVDQGYPVRVSALFEEALALGREAGDTKNIAYSLCGLATVAIYAGDRERANALAQEAVAVSREFGDKYVVARSLVTVQLIGNFQSDHERLEVSGEEALALYRELGNKLGVADVLNNLGYDALLSGDSHRAAVYLEECLALSRELNHRIVYAISLSNLGWARLILHEDAEKLFRESLDLSRQTGDRIVTAECLEGFAALAGVVGDNERAARLWSAAGALREKTVPLSPDEEAIREPYLEAARSRLSDVAWDEARRAGRDMTLDEAVSFALEEEDRDVG